MMARLALIAVSLLTVAQTPAPTPTPKPPQWRVTFENHSNQNLDRIVVAGYGWDSHDREDQLGDQVLAPGRFVTIVFLEDHRVGYTMRHCSVPVEIVLHDGTSFKRDLDPCATARWIVTDTTDRLVAR